MLWLAQLITKSRINACLCAVAGSIVPMLTPATLSLVVLTKHYREAVLVLLCAIAIPLFAPNQMGDIYQLMVFIIMAALVVTLLTSYLLKYSRSWVLTLLAISALSSFGGIIAIAFVNLPHIADQVQLKMVEFAKANNQPTDLIIIAASDLQAFTAYGIALQTALALLIARWWQSELFKQGAFGTEIRALRLDYRLSLLLAVLLIAILFTDSISKVWQLPVVLPLVIGGCTLLHWYSHHVRKLSSGMFALFYIMLFVVELSVYIVAILAIVDSFIDCRKKWHKS